MLRCVFVFVSGCACVCCCLPKVFCVWFSNSPCADFSVAAAPTSSTVGLSECFFL